MDIDNDAKPGMEETPSKLGVVILGGFVGIGWTVWVSGGWEWCLCLTITIHKVTYIVVNYGRQRSRRHLCGRDSTLFVEIKFEISTAMWRVGIHECFGIAERVEYGSQGFYLFSQLQLLFWVCRQSEDLTEKESLTWRFSWSCYTPYYPLRQWRQRRTGEITNLVTTACDSFLRRISR